MNQMNMRLDTVLNRNIAVLEERGKIDKEFMIHMSTHTNVMKKTEKVLDKIVNRLEQENLKKWL